MADLRTFFTDAFENLSDKEDFYKAVFMNMEGDEALQAFLKLDLEMKERRKND